MINTKISAILSEISKVLNSVSENEVSILIRELLNAKTIVVCGAGRVGMATRGFAMRLGHLGLKAYSLGDSTVPAVGQGDILLVSSGSGETQSTLDITTIAKNNNCKIILVTGNPDSRIGKIADHIVTIKAPSKTKSIDNFTSIQPMTTLNEQSLGIFYDAVVLELMEQTRETGETMWNRHSNLE